MKIKSFELFKVPPRWLFLKIETDNGIIGWGEPIVEGKADTVKAAVIELMESLIGKDPQDIETHWNNMYRGGFYRGGPVLMSALSGIDQALWDIKGKFFNTPIYNLMGGKARDKVKVYSWIAGETKEDLVNGILRAKSEGFEAVKMNATNELQIIDSYKKIDWVLERVAALREAVGYSVDIGIDFHGRLHKAMAKVMASALDEYHPMFIEEAVEPENNEALRDIANACSIPIATGERMFSRWQFKKILSSGYVDIIQPDLSHAGGITECKKIISMAEAYDVAAAPHCPLGPIALSACLQVDASCHNAFIQEQSLGVQYSAGDGKDLLNYLTDKSVFDFKDGFVEVIKGPGLGIEVNEEYVKEQAKISHNWKSPTWFNKDGSIAEW
ncbi:galactonate dehydratase [Arcticibacterium luteifluviistationis]|uniref:Galactonate dehydratase n=1 Tax=Arcticibacterium luteifluviistationis TaxID=1784714 RepID=A0A2Z4G6I7_9BACT|nr:galactonate dehydratase [Arcticibacterium luteifluviistationis]AWV96744.1 galactonate dehydratase [Arcticibacterium luteifluviistationis]